jgi:hypothetical protein
MLVGIMVPACPAPLEVTGGQNTRHDLDRSLTSRRQADSRRK